MDGKMESSSKTKKSEFNVVDVGSLTSTVHSLPGSTIVVNAMPKRTIEESFMEIETWVAKKLSPFSSENKGNSLYPVSIFKVPKKLFKANEDAFVPRLVSIGPYHHGSSNLQAMELCKLRCLNWFKKRYPWAINDIISELMDKETQIRGCYENTFGHLNSEQFVIMMMLDAIFIIELTLMESRASHEKIFDNWMMSEILHDMLLLENQIPWFVLSLCLRRTQPEEMMEKEIEVRVKEFFDSLEALIIYFKGMGIICPPKVILTQTVHSSFVEMLGTSLLPGPQRREPGRHGKLELLRSATELRDAGVKFTKGSDWKALLDMDFREGELIIPQLTINEWTETFFRNQIAFEQSGKLRRDKVITSYAIFMDSLINTSSDVDVLVDCGIINDLLNDSRKVADLFNNLHKETLMDNKRFYFAKLCEELNDYSRDYWYQWKARLLKWKRMLGSDNYFGNPWTTISVIAACILLALTIIQTYSGLTGDPVTWNKLDKLLNSLNHNSSCGYP